MGSRRHRSCAKLFSFSGIDGAGKSSQIQNLCATITGKGLRFKLITFWDDVATLTRIREETGHRVFRGDKGVGTPSAPINRRDKNVRSGLMTCVRLCLYLADAISLRVVMKRAMHSDADVVIFDRFIYDELANLTLQNPLMRAYVWSIMKIVPRPHVSYLLDADPVQARARKPEYPLEFLYSNRQSYLALSALVGAITIIPPMPIHEVEREILQYALEELGTSPNSPFPLRLSPESAGSFASAQLPRSSPPANRNG